MIDVQALEQQVTNCRTTLNALEHAIQLAREINAIEHRQKSNGTAVAAPAERNGKPRVTTNKRFAPNGRAAVLSVVRRGETVSTATVAKRIVARNLIDASHYRDRGVFMSTVWSLLYRCNPEISRLPRNGAHETHWRRAK